jgi:hypothetical protein
MAGHGPPPKHPTTRARRNAPMANTTQLPAEGRKGKPPVWPLPADRDLRAALGLAETEAGLIEDEIAHQDGEADPALRRDLRRALARVVVAEGDLRITEAEELRLWATLWALPQAVAWERLGYLNEVAQYVRWKVRAELGELQASKESRYIGDRLGLTPASMLHLRWEIVSDELADRRGDPPAAPTSRRRAPAKKTSRRKPPDPRAALSMVK